MGLSARLGEFGEGGNNPTTFTELNEVLPIPEIFVPSYPAFLGAARRPQ